MTLILAGDIGGTKTALALYEERRGKLLAKASCHFLDAAESNRREGVEDAPTP